MLDLTKLRDAIRYQGGVDRRLFLAYGSALSSIPLLGHAACSTRVSRFAKDPFSLGVASGDPDSEGFVIWTRLAPEPTEVPMALATSLAPMPQVM